jgi:PKD repeat protein
MNKLWWDGWRRNRMMTRLSRVLAGVPSAPKKMSRRRLVGAAGVTLMLAGITAGFAGAATTIPVLWSAGGLDAGTTGAGQAGRMTTDAAGNVAVVSGPSGGRDLAVTSYTPEGTLRWRRTISPSLGTFSGDWAVAAPNGDIVAVGHNVTSSGNPIAITMVRYASDGTLMWRVDLARTSPNVARLLVDAGGNAYLAFNSVGDGQDIQVHKYNPSGGLVWSQVVSTGFMANDIATSLALSPDETDVVVTGNIIGGATWITAAYNALTGARRWLVTAAEGIIARDVVVDATRVYVTGQGNVGISGFLTVVAYNRTTGARLWRTDKKPADGTAAAGLRMDLAPDGSLVVAGQAARGFLDWYTVAFETNGVARWEAVRDGGLNTDEFPAGVVVLADGTTVLTGRGGPNLPGGFIQGVTAGYSPTGTLLWEAFSRMETIWPTALPDGNVCASGGYDALITCWQVSGGLKAVMSATPSTGTAPLTVTFDGSGSTTPNGVVTSWAWLFGNGASGTGSEVTYVYTTPGTYTATLTVTDSAGASSTATSTIVVNPLPPAAPTGLTASLSGYLVLLAWQDNSSNETLFYIERCAGPGCTSFSDFVATQWPDVPNYTDYSALTGQSYSYRVRAYNAGGYSPYSNIATIVAGGSNLPPTAPKSLTATALTRSSIGLKWTNGTTDQTEVQIERCTGSSCTNFTQVAVVAGTATTFTDSGLAKRTTYRYRVRAHSALGNSPYSNIASARTKG